MMLSAPSLKVIHLTTHVGLIEAVERINPKRAYTVIQLANQTLSNAGYQSPSIAVCGINPHAGENGLFGNGEEEEKLIPSIAKAKEEGVNITVGLRNGIIRTSVDHGTAFDIAGKGLADERSLMEALLMAVDLAPKDLGERSV